VIGGLALRAAFSIIKRLKLFSKNK
jgi:hypothetical protein